MKPLQLGSSKSLAVGKSIYKVIPTRQFDPIHAVGRKLINILLQYILLFFARGL